MPARGICMFGFGVALVGCTEHGQQSEVRCGQPGVIVNIGPTEAEELAGCTTFAGSARFGDTQLVAIPGLESLRVIEGTLNFFRNPNLIDLGGLRNLETVVGEVLVHHNPVLAGIADLERLGSTGEMLVSNNSSLVEIGLDRLETVNGDLRITGNPSLSQTDAERFVVGLVVTGIVDISDNAR